MKDTDIMHYSENTMWNILAANPGLADTSEVPEQPQCDLYDMP